MLKHVHELLHVVALFGGEANGTTGKQLQGESLPTLKSQAAPRRQLLYAEI